MPAPTAQSVEPHRATQQSRTAAAVAGRGPLRHEQELLTNRGIEENSCFFPRADTGSGTSLASPGTMLTLPGASAAARPSPFPRGEAISRPSTRERQRRRAPSARLDDNARFAPLWSSRGDITGRQGCANAVARGTIHPGHDVSDMPRRGRTGHARFDLLRVWCASAQHSAT